MQANQYQDLTLFQVAADFRGRPGWFVQLWWMVESMLFRPSPQFLYGWRRFLLRVFGAKIGEGVLIRPSATVTYPWKLSIGDHSWIGDQVVLYTLGQINVGSHSVISQGSYICSGTHDSRQLAFPLVVKPINIGDECWIATDVFVAPGVNIGYGAMVAARSTVTKDLPEGVVATGNPAVQKALRKVNTEVS